MKLKTFEKFSFGITDLGQNVYLNLISFYLVFFITDLVGLSPIMAGYIMVIGRLWDAVTDPIVGYISDRTQTRFGRRRPYMFIGSFVLALSMVGIFLVTKGDEPMKAFYLLVFFYCMANTGFTLVNIPYAAMVPEITKDYDERTNLTAWRMSAAIIGTFIAAGATLPLANSVGWPLMSIIWALIVLVTPMITIAVIKEPKRHKIPHGGNIFSSLISVLKVKPFLLALIPWGLFQMGINFTQASLIHYYKYIYHNEGIFQFGLMALLGMALLFIPLWVWVSKKIGKKSTYIIGMSWVAIALLVFFLIGHRIPAIYSVVILAAAGIGMSTHYVMPHAILPDIVEYDAHKYGQRREGIYSAMWTFAAKTGLGAAGLITGFALEAFGFVANVEQSSKALFGIRFISGPLATITLIIGGIILFFFPITKEYYKQNIIEDESVA